MVRPQRHVGLLPRSVALGRLRGFCCWFVFAAGRRTKVAERLFGILGSPETPRPGEKQFWRFTERRWSALDGPSSNFPSLRAGVSGAYLFKRSLRPGHVAFDDV